MKAVYFFLLSVLMLQASGQDNCSNPVVVTGCNTTFTNQSNAAMTNDRTIWSNEWAYNTIQAPGKDMVYKIIPKAGTTNLQIKISNLSMSGYLFIPGNICGYGSFSSSTMLYLSPYAANSIQINANSSSPVYVWIDFANTADATFDISFGSDAPAPPAQIKGNWQWDITCPAGITKKGINITYNGNQMYQPLTFTPLNTPGDLCIRLIFQNKTGSESFKKVVFTFDPDFINVAPKASSMNGIYTSGSWDVTSSGAGKVFTWNFNNNTNPGKGDFSGLPNSCLSYDFCFTVTPISNNPNRTNVNFQMFGDWSGSFSDGMCCLPGRCSGGASSGPSSMASSINDPASLPIDWLSFTGTANGNVYALHWQTAKEFNSAFFQIERSIDGIHFDSIGRVAAAGQSAGVSSYVFQDVYANSGQPLYYRIMETDLNGSTVYSHLLGLQLEELLQVTVYPNPVKDLLTIQSDIDMAGIRIQNAAGEPLYSEDFPGIRRATVNLSVYAKGVYIISVYTENATINKLIVIE